MSPLYCLLFVAFLCSLQTISAAPGGFNDVDASNNEVVAALNALNGDIRTVLYGKYPDNPIGYISAPESARVQLVGNAARRYQITFYLSLPNMTRFGTPAPQRYFTADITVSGGAGAEKYRLNDVVSNDPNAAANKIGYVFNDN